MGGHLQYPYVLPQQGSQVYTGQAELNSQSTYSPEPQAILYGAIGAGLAYEVMTAGFRTSPAIGMLVGAGVFSVFALNGKKLLQNYWSDMTTPTFVPGPHYRQ